MSTPNADAELDVVSSSIIGTITYTAPSVSEIASEDTTAEVIYTNEAGFTHNRYINIPRLEDGSINEEYYQEILEGQLCGVENKVVVGVISFTDPNSVTEDAETSEEEAPAA